MKNLLTLLCFLGALYACKTDSKPDAKVESPPAVETTAANDWISLFDGTSTDGWRVYNGKELPPEWVIEDGVLTFKTERILETEKQGNRDIIYGLEEFDNFELYLEWKLPEGGNSGIFYHIKEGYDAPPVVAPEYQLIDDEGYTKIHDVTAYNTGLGFENPSQLHPLQKTGADYAMYTADPSQKSLNPTGEWNTSRIIFTPTNAEYWLNGKKLLSFVPWSEDWNKRKNAGKWNKAEDYGKFKTGYIGLQDHGSELWFRNIKIKKL